MTISKSAMYTSQRMVAQIQEWPFSWHYNYIWTLSTYSLRYCESLEKTTKKSARKLAFFFV